MPFMGGLLIENYKVLPVLYSEVMFLSLFLFNQVKEKTLVEALTQKRATAGDETVVMNYKMHDVSS